ncbi:subunit of the ESCRT-I complex [Corchorus olitorius]|uniref:Subunit of the ESCRT-I complex n=1 Tax=Corchorus olitorius TaxID=93759 RepID=A0A1R3KW60_9ROSI|nr:subunit of the ESCRT-I complex [Corchorus olitorius]
MISSPSLLLLLCLLTCSLIPCLIGCSSLSIVQVFALQFSHCPRSCECEEGAGDSAIFFISRYHSKSSIAHVVHHEVSAIGIFVLFLALSHSSSLLFRLILPRKVIQIIAHNLMILLFVNCLPMLGPLLSWFTRKAPESLSSTAVTPRSLMSLSPSLFVEVSLMSLSHWLFVEVRPSENFYALFGCFA